MYAQIFNTPLHQASFNLVYLPCFAFLFLYITQQIISTITTIAVGTPITRAVPAIVIPSIAPTPGKENISVLLTKYKSQQIE